MKEYRGRKGRVLRKEKKSIEEGKEEYRGRKYRGRNDRVLRKEKKSIEEG